MFFKPPCFPDIESLIIDGLPQNVQGQVKKVVFDFDESCIVKGLGSGSASTARGATVYFHDEKVIDYCFSLLKLYLILHFICFYLIF